MLKTESLSGSQLIAAVKLAIRKSYTALAQETKAMDLPELQAYLAAHPEVDLGDGTNDDREDIRNAILAHHEYLPEDGLGQPITDDDILRMCETILERYGYTTGRRVDLSTGYENVVWRAETEDEGFHVYGKTVREAIMRCYVTDKLGKEVDI